MFVTRSLGRGGGSRTLVEQEEEAEQQGEGEHPCRLQGRASPAKADFFFWKGFKFRKLQMDTHTQLISADVQFYFSSDRDHLFEGIQVQELILT